jgi:8-oxo-dGTP diphosphatase
MNWVYSICYVGDRFVMVYNPKRNGWEMPGGRIESNELAEKAAIREVREECGCDLSPVASVVRRDGMVFCGELMCAPDANDKAEMRWDLFSELPSPLAFRKEEYDEVLAWSRATIVEHRVSIKDFRSLL